MKRAYNSQISQRANESLRRRERALQVRRRMSVLVLIVVVCLAILLGSSIRALASSHGKEELHKYYTSIQLESGDTLWDLADDYTVDGVMDREDFIREVEKINGLSDDGRIHSGSYIVVPYYSLEEKRGS